MKKERKSPTPSSLCLHRRAPPPRRRRHDLQPAAHPFSVIRVLLADPLPHLQSLHPAPSSPWAGAAHGAPRRSTKPSSLISLHQSAISLPPPSTNRIHEKGEGSTGRIGASPLNAALIGREWRC